MCWRAPIAWLSRQQSTYDPMLLYVSDHGESLGENGLYLHGLPYAVAPREQKQVPMVVWVPTQASTRLAAAPGLPRQQRDRPLSHDNLFHTVAGALGLRASEVPRRTRRLRGLPSALSGATQNSAACAGAAASGGGAEQRQVQRLALAVQAQPRAGLLEALAQQLAPTRPRPSCALPKRAS